jgi:hypothetical protein
MMVLDDTKKIESSRAVYLKGQSLEKVCEIITLNDR